MDVTHRRQPTPTSCGPTCAAMLAGVLPKRMIGALPTVRASATRRAMRTHRTNIGELRRLLAPHGLSVGHRRPWPSTAGPFPARALLRVDHLAGRGWHWVVAAYGDALDPAEPRPRALASYVRRVGRSRVSVYEVKVA